MVLQIIMKVKITNKKVEKITILRQIKMAKILIITIIMMRGMRIEIVRIIKI